MRFDSNSKVRDLTIDARANGHARVIVSAVKKIKGVSVVNVSDCVFLMHLGGKIHIQNKMGFPLRATIP